MGAEFDELCQKVNSILVEMLVKAGFKRFKTKGNQKKTVVYQYKIWKFLATSNLNGLVDVRTCVMDTRFGVIAIIQILADLLNRNYGMGYWITQII